MAGGFNSERFRNCGLVNFGKLKNSIICYCSFCFFFFLPLQTENVKFVYKIFRKVDSTDPIRILLYKCSRSGEKNDDKNGLVTSRRLALEQQRSIMRVRNCSNTNRLYDGPEKFGFRLSIYKAASAVMVRLVEIIIFMRKSCNTVLSIENTRKSFRH